MTTRWRRALATALAAGAILAACRGDAPAPGDPGTTGLPTGRDPVAVVPAQPAPPDAPPPDCGARRHVVLVPGFGGFDSLGRIRYYAGVAGLHRRLGLERRCVVVHAFDSLPTASVETRARRLGDWLSRRVDDATIRAGDTLHLVGHSTGGRDIRALVDGLAGRGDPWFAADPGIRRRELLDRLATAQFLSAPQRGTNLGRRAAGAEAVLRDFFQAVYQCLVWTGQAGAGEAGACLQRELEAIRASGGDGSIVDAVGRCLPCVWGFGRHAIRPLEAVLGADFPPPGVDGLRAVADALAEVAPGPGGGGTGGAWDESAARGDWLRLLGWVYEWSADLQALTSISPDAEPGRAPPPAADADAPGDWATGVRVPGWPPSIRVRSYVTVGPAPDALHPLDPYRLAWIATAGTFPEVRPRWLLPLRWICEWLADPPPASLLPPGTAPGAGVAVRRLDGTGERVLTLADSDGFVNGVSQVWPSAAASRLVEADHGDVIGHFALSARDPDAAPGGAEAPAGDRPRRFATYDLLGSGSGFDRAAFDALWGEVLGFASSHGAAPVPQ